MNGGREKESGTETGREIEGQKSSHMQSPLDHLADSVQLIMYQKAYQVTAL